MEGPLGLGSVLDAGGCHVVLCLVAELCQKACLIGTLAILNSDLWSGLWPIFGPSWPQNPSRMTGLVLQCRVHRKSAPQINSKASPWQFGIRNSLFSLSLSAVSGPY